MQVDLSVRGKKGSYNVVSFLGEDCLNRWKGWDGVSALLSQPAPARRKCTAFFHLAQLQPHTQLQAKQTQGEVETR